MKVLASLVAGLLLAALGYLYAAPGPWRLPMALAGFVVGVVASIATVSARREIDQVEKVMERDLD